MPKVTKGRLYVSGKKGAYHIQYYVNGKEFKKTLHDEKGNIVTGKREAERLAAILMQPFNVKEQASRMEQIQMAAESASSKAARIEAEAEDLKSKEEERRRERLASIDNGWTLFMQCPKRPRACKAYTAKIIPNNTTASCYLSYYRRFAKWLKSKRKNISSVSQVTADDALAFMKTVEKNSSNGTYNKYLTFLACFYKTLVEAGKINCANPFADIDRAEQTYNSKSPLSMEQIARILDTADGDYKLLIALGIGTGLRFGDCCTLRWSEVDLMRGTIERIPHKTAHMVKDKSQAIVKVGIPGFLFEMLILLPEERRNGLYVLPEIAEQYFKNHTIISNRIQEIFNACGIQTIRRGTGEGTGNRAVVDYGFHSLRYSYITFHAEHGTPQAVIQRNAGHSNPAMTAHYEKISDAAARKYAEVIDITPTTEGTHEGNCDERVKLLAWVQSADDDKVKTVWKLVNGL